MQEETLSVNEVKLLEEILKTDKELKAFVVQKTQHKAAINEFNETKKELKDKSVTKVQLPSVGGMLKTYSCSSKKVLDLIDMNIKRMETAVKGIDGQITHRQDILNENIQKLASAFLGRLDQNGIKLKKTGMAKYFKDADK